MSNPSRTHPNITPCLSGFHHIRRHWSDEHRSVVGIIEPGQLYVTKTEELIMTTLGSCIAACIRDPLNGIGGMNHFMLPVMGSVYQDTTTDVSGAMRYGNWSMEYLINQLLKFGAKRRNLEVKVFGAAGVFENSSLCELNINFITQYIHDENLKLVAQDLGGSKPRVVIYNAVTGKVLMKLLSERTKDIDDSETKYTSSIKTSYQKNDVELF